MLKFLRGKSSSKDEPATDSSSEHTEEPSNTDSEAAPEVKKRGFFRKLSQGLSRTRGHFSEGMANVFLGKKTIDEDLLEELETLLLTADVGIEASQAIIEDLALRVKRKALQDPQALLAALRENLIAILQDYAEPLVIDKRHKPYVLLMVGVNGSGKTTTIGKLAKQFQQQDYTVMLAAGDTFRAAAIEQLQVWGERNAIPVISQHSGADSASVIYDAVQAAQARGIDILLADTAGRLHTQAHLMEELKKVKRVITKLDDSAPHEVMLVLDASIGQNALSQAEQFKAAVDVSGICLTKLDGTAKGGIIFAIAKQLQLPIRYIGVGEGIDDLRPFDASEFVEALFTTEQ